MYLPSMGPIGTVTAVALVGNRTGAWFTVSCSSVGVDAADSLVILTCQRIFCTVSAKGRSVSLWTWYGSDQPPESVG